MRRSGAVTPATVNAAMVVLDHEEHIEPVQEDGIDVGEVHCSDRLSLGGQELLPSGGTREAWVMAVTCSAGLTGDGERFRVREAL